MNITFWIILILMLLLVSRCNCIGSALGVPELAIENTQYDPPVLPATLLCFVVRDRAALTIAAGYDSPGIDTGLDKVKPDRPGTEPGQLPIVSGRTPVIGVTGDFCLQVDDVVGQVALP